MPYKDKAKQLAYQNAWMQKRRQDWLDANGPCVDCGSDENLEVDHVDSEDKVTHRVWSWREDRRLAELAKCIVRCNVCHKIKSAKEHAKGSDNGTSKLSENQVVEIRKRKSLGEESRALATEFQVHIRTIQRVATSINSWKHI